MKGGRDEQLIEQSLRGSEKAFRELVERHHSVVYAVVRGVLGDRDDVDDVVQEVLIKVYRNLHRFRGDSKFSTWIYRIARNEAINAAKRRVMQTDPIEDVVVESTTMRPDEHVSQSDTQETLESYLGQLDENYRVALELRYLGEKSYTEIAEAMELPLGTVKTYIHRGKAELKRIMTHRTRDGRARYES